MNLQEVAGKGKARKDPSISPSLEALAPYPSKAIAARARKDPDFVNLAIGEPWFGPPELLLSHLSDLLGTYDAPVGFRTYVDSRGGAPLRDAIAARLRDQAIVIDPERDLLITHGAAEAFSAAILAGTAVGDDVLIPDPTYMIYEPICKILGRNPVRPRMAVDFALDEKAIARATTPKTRMIVVNSPCNPSGWVATHDELAWLLDFSRERGIWLLHDEVYDDFVYDDQHHISVLTLDAARNHSIQVNSVSKRYGIPGLRIGWIVARHDFIDAAVRVHEHLTLSVAYLSDSIAARLISDDATRSWVIDCKRELQKKRDRTITLLRQLDGVLEVPSPRGGFFVFVNVSPMAKRLGLTQRHLDVGTSVAHHLASHFKLAVVPGAVYGRSGRDFIRLVFAVEDAVLEDGLQRLKAAFS